MSKKPAYHPCLDRIAEAIVADDRGNAKDCVETSFAESNSFVEAWLVKAWTSDSLQEAEASIQQALQLDPGNEVALAGMNWLLGIQEFADTQLELKSAEEKEQQRFEEEAQARLEAEEQAKRDAEEEQARLEAKEQARLDAAAEKVRQQVEERRRLEAEKQAQWEAEEKARLEAEKEIEKQKRIAAEEARWQEQQQAQQAAEEQADQDEDFEFFGELESPKANETTSDENEAGLLDEVKMLSDEINKSGGATEEAEAGDSSEQPASNQNGGKTVVLAVDDSPTVRKLVALTLTREGFEVLEAENGIEALNILGQQLPDIILSDINMPKLNGYKLCKFVKKHERTRNIPVVMLSGKDGVFDKMRGKLSGCDDFISKPFESAALVEKVREHLNSSVKA